MMSRSAPAWDAGLEALERNVMRTKTQYDMTQIAEAVKSRTNPMVRTCNVYACDHPASVDINIGGGNMIYANCLCNEHAKAILEELRSLLATDEP